MGGNQNQTNPIAAEAGATGGVSYATSLPPSDKGKLYKASYYNTDKIEKNLYSSPPRSIAILQHGNVGQVYDTPRMKFQPLTAKGQVNIDNPIYEDIDVKLPTKTKLYSKV